MRACRRMGPPTGRIPHDGLQARASLNTGLGFHGFAITTTGIRNGASPAPFRSYIASA